jgi:hypothetical protein
MPDRRDFSMANKIDEPLRFAETTPLTTANRKHSQIQWTPGQHVARKIDAMHGGDFVIGCERWPSGAESLKRRSAMPHLLQACAWSSQLWLVIVR